MKNQEKVEKSGNNRTKEEKLGRKSKNQEGSLCPSWQIGWLATLLVQICACIQTFVNFCSDSVAKTTLAILCDTGL